MSGEWRIRGPATGAPTQGLSRRRLLGAAGTAMTAGLAGCSEVTSREFAASPVRLPEGVRAELGFTELFADTHTTTHERTVGGEDLEVTITSHFAGYWRSSPAVADSGWVADRPTLVDRFVGIDTETPGAGNIWSAINAVASELELGQSNPSYVEEDVAMDPGEVTLVLPERARHDDEVRFDEVMTVHHAAALGVDELTYPGAGNAYVVDSDWVLPDRAFAPSDKPDWSPDDRWIPVEGNGWIPDDPSSLQCLVCLGERSPQSVFGVDEMPGRKLEEGETVATENTIMFQPAPKEYPDPDSWSPDPAQVFDAGYPTPMGGPSYALGVVATPNAEVAGESVNPLARLGTDELLTSDLLLDVLGDAGLTDADDVEWLRGPEQQPGQQWTPTDTVDVLGEEAGLESYGGVVSGAAGLWAVALHLAKATPDDVVVPVAMHRRPVGNYGRPLYPTDGRGLLDKRWTLRAMEFTTQVAASLRTTGGTDG